jgi:hypothetical protein
VSSPTASKRFCNSSSLSSRLLSSPRNIITLAKLDGPWTDRIGVQQYGWEVTPCSPSIRPCMHTLHTMDPKSVKMTVGYGINHTATKTHIPYNWSKYIQTNKLHGP